MADELAFLTITEAARLIEQKRLSPVELTTVRGVGFVLQ